MRRVLGINNIFQMIPWNIYEIVMPEGANNWCLNIRGYWLTLPHSRRLSLHTHADHLKPPSSSHLTKQ